MEKVAERVAADPPDGAVTGDGRAAPGYGPAGDQCTGWSWAALPGPVRAQARIVGRPHGAPQGGADGQHPAATWA